MLKLQKKNSCIILLISLISMFFVGGSSMLLPANKSFLLEYYGVNLYALSCWFFNDKMSWRSYIING